MVSNDEGRCPLIIEVILTVAHVSFGVGLRF